MTWPSEDYYDTMCNKIDAVTTGTKEGEGHAVNNPNNY